MGNKSYLRRLFSYAIIEKTRLKRISMYFKIVFILLILSSNLCSMENSFKQLPEPELKRNYSCPELKGKNRTSGELKEIAECAICKDILYKNVQKEVVLILFCKHSFHEICLKEWLKKQNTCPLCRDKIGERNSTANSIDIEAQNRQNRENRFHRLNRKQKIACLGITTAYVIAVAGIVATLIYFNNN